MMQKKTFDEMKLVTFDFNGNPERQRNEITIMEKKNNFA